MHDDQIELPALNGARVLVVQNDQFMAADVDLMIDDAGGKVVALAASHDDALSLLGREPIDAAVVDPNLGDEEAASFIEALNRRDIPFVIYPPSTG
jgi:DNA-binding NarL/FixJ family response regulator